MTRDEAAKILEPRARRWGFWVPGPRITNATWCPWRHVDTDRNICADDPVWPGRDDEESVFKRP